MVTELTNDDITVLLEALVAWEDKDAAGDLIGVVLTGLVTPKDPESQAAMKAEQAKQQAERAESKRNRKEQSVLLQAKLIQMRPRAIAEGVDASLRAPR